MGIIIAKFRKKKTTYEVLDKLQDEINSIEEFRRSTEQTQKKMVGRFIVISVCVYFITALVLYFYFFPASAYERILYIIPLILIPVLLFFIKRILTWYYNRKLVKNQKKLASLRDEKKKLLEEVMDKETYKVAKTILEKFAPDQVKKTVNMSESATPVRPIQPQTLGSMQLTGVRYRGPQSQLLTPASARPGIRPALMPSATPSINQTPMKSQIVPRPSGQMPTLKMPREILPKDRSVLEKMVDFLVGDGPSNRFALICSNCSSHNGMALQEEFEYFSFRCCYCMTFNPARKQRPQAPSLEKSIEYRKSDKSNSSSSTESDEEGPIVEEPQDEATNIRSDDETKMETDEIEENGGSNEAKTETILSEPTKD